MTPVFSEDLGKLINRLCVSILMLFHGYHYLTAGSNVDARMVTMGLPSFTGDVGQWLGEIIAPLAIILGVYSRLGGLVIAVYMVVALLLAHTGNGHLLQLNENGDGYRLEIQFFFLVGGLSVMLLGSGKYGLKIGDRWN